MRRSTLAFLVFILAIGLVIWAYVIAEQRSAFNITDAKLQEWVENSRSETPQNGLAQDWFDCLEREALENLTAKKIPCKTWTVQGVRSTLYALSFDQDLVPVIESRLDSTRETGLIVVDVVGGPGQEPFHVNSAFTEEFVERLRKGGSLDIFHGAIAKDLPQYQLMQRGFTIASLGYWGMNIRTFNEPDEIDFAVRDVRLALDHYRDQLGQEPPLITTSLGNHLVLGAIGKVRLENANILALVPVMDGLKHHVDRFKTEMAEQEAENELSQGFRVFSIYSRSNDGVEFDHSRMLLMGDFVVQFLGASDYKWRDISLSGRCSKVVLGSKDPRTKAYLAATKDLPSFVEVWESDHDIVLDAPEKTRAAFAGYADCLLAQKSQPASNQIN